MRGVVRRAGRDESGDSGDRVLKGGDTALESGRGQRQSAGGLAEAQEGSVLGSSCPSSLEAVLAHGGEHHRGERLLTRRGGVDRVVPQVRVLVIHRHRAARVAQSSREHALTRRPPLSLPVSVAATFPPFVCERLLTQRNQNLNLNLNLNLSTGASTRLRVSVCIAHTGQP